MTKSLENILTLAGVRGISSTSYFGNIQSSLGLSKGSVCDLGRPLVQDPGLAEKGFFWAHGCCRRCCNQRDKNAGSLNSFLIQFYKFF